MHENVTNLDTIFVQIKIIVCFIDTREMCTNPECVVNHRSQQTTFSNIKLKHFKRESKQTCQDDHVTSKQIMKPLVMGMSTTILQPSCASASLAFNQLPDGCLGEYCPMHVTCETASSSSSFVSLKQKNWLLSAIEAIHWSNIISTNLVRCHAQNCFW